MKRCSNSEWQARFFKMKRHTDRLGGLIWDRDKLREKVRELEKIIADQEQQITKLEGKYYCIDRDWTNHSIACEEIFKELEQTFNKWFK